MKRMKLKSVAGVTLIELMIALVITGIMATASFKFYAAMNGRSLAQQEVSDLQLVCRNTMQELKKTIRMAGYKVTDHVPLEVVGDTLNVYMAGVQPIDTVRYFLAPLNTGDTQLGDLASSRNVFRMVKQLNSDYPATFSDYITNVNFNVVDAANLEITVTAESTERDPDYRQNNGYRSYSLTEKVRIRNAG